MFSLLEALRQHVNPSFGWVSPVAYAFGLLTVGCLALRGRKRGLAISGLLAVLGLWMALWVFPVRLGWAGPKTWLALGLLVQSGLFLWLGMFRSRLVFEPRASIRPIAGTVLLIHALAIHPLCRSFLEPEHLPLHLPFSGLFLALGLMLFLRRPVPYQILVLPLLWTALGGERIFEAPGWVDLVNLVALAFSLLLLVPRPESRRDGDENYRVELRQERAYRYRHWCGRLLWGLVLSTGLFTFLGHAAPAPLTPHFIRLAASSAVVLAGAIIFWLMSPAWFHIGFRYLVWWAVRGLHGLSVTGRWLTAGWKRLMVGAAVAGLALWPTGYHRKLLGVLGGGGESAVENRIYLLIAGLLVLVFLRAVYRARRSIVILPFIDSCGSSEEAERRGKALASRLRNELANTAELYRTIDEALPQEENKIVVSSVAVDDVVESALEAIGPDTNVKVWSLEIPIGLLMRVVSRIVHGPRLTGSFQKDGKRLFLAAELSGGRWGPGSWKVSSDDLDFGGEKAVVDALDAAERETLIAQRLIEQLACRIIAKIGNVGSPRWEAIHHFTQGLRAYRGTQRADKDVGPDLRRAEREFIQALREDGSFTQCHYDLGVVYQKLGEMESAEASFRRCLGADPARSEAYYSLADVYYDRGDFRRASIYAGKALETQPEEARTWNLRGVAQETERRKKIRKEGEGAPVPLPEEVRTDLEIAVAVAWRDLCWAVLMRPSVQPRKELWLAGLCLANLAIVRQKDGNSEGGETSLRLIQQALYLSPQEPWYHLILGENLVFRGEGEDFERARTELYRAFGDNLASDEDAERWAYLLAALEKLSEWKRRGQLGCEAEISRAFRHFLDAIVPPEDLILAGGQRARQRASVSSYQETLAKCERTLLDVAPLTTGEGALLIAALRNSIRFLRRLYVGPLEPEEPRKDPPGEGPVRVAPYERRWRRAQLAIYQARIALDRNPRQARVDLTKAIDILKALDGQGWPTRQVARQGLHALCARACLLERQAAPGGSLLREALAHAQQAVAERPESAARRWILADVYGALRDFDQAEAEREMALQRGSGLGVLDDAEAVCGLARSYLQYADVPDAELQKKHYQKARERFRTLQVLIESRPLAQDREAQDLQTEVHACIHFWLGRFDELLDEGSKAIYHLEIARAMGYSSDDAAHRLKRLRSGKRPATVDVQAPDNGGPPSALGSIAPALAPPSGSPQPPN